MATQSELHGQVLKRISELEKIIDQLKRAGPCERDGWNALINTRDHLESLAQRCWCRAMDD